MIFYTQLETDLGPLQVTSQDGKLSGLYFKGQLHVPSVGRDWIRQDDLSLFLETARQLEEYRTGTRRSFDLPLGLRGTPFQIKVWQQIAAIPFGETRSYGDLAARIGCPKAVRAVGTAAGRNPVCWIVPCHRVIGKDGSLTGFAGGLHRKRALLDFESGRSVKVELEPELVAA